MAQVTPPNLGVFDSGDFFRDHVKVLHVMAWRRLVALGAIGRSWRGMDEFLHRPGIGRVTGAAILSEFILMTVLF